ncbi:MAG: hypothetical protein CO119_00195 [Flavobacteriales bacterium CG_4_9_14_3_um_filter_40_17]|nr:MAG: hypothetical protein CO119_00195 [Flavobacteriales bacterium CG_4_9_14_3_um_filter_40_17]
MFLEIITPEAVIFNDKVEVVSLPGSNGEFQILNNHAPIVSTLKKGFVKIKGSFESTESFEKMFSKKDNVWCLMIDSGTVESNENKVVILID